MISSRLGVAVSEGPRNTKPFSEDPTTVGELTVIPNAARAKKPFVLEQVGGPGAPRQFELELPQTVVGRSLSAHISIDSGLISRQHMSLRRSGTEVSCVDMGSANGMFLNGVRAHSAVLRQGDTIQIGDVIFVFHEGN
jgi:pSer/pThr/pTyr-binding forkhead associated (FHA) protein